MRLIALVCALLAGLMAMPAVAGEKEIAALKAVLAEGPLDIGLFAADFLKAVPAATLTPVIEQTKALIGPVVAVEERGGTSYAVETATHEMLTEIGLDNAGKIAGLLFRPAVAKNASIDDLLKEIGGLAPQVGYYISKDGTALYQSNGQLPLAIGSAFKLGVLKALKAEIDAGTRKWSDVVTLNAADLSLPSGMLQGWPVGSPLTLHTLAALMLSISDNTATDVLIHALGRDKVEAALGIAPVLTTRELFALKFDRAAMARYQAADLAGKRAVLEELATRPPAVPTSALPPLDDEAEWYVSAEALCALIGDVGGLDVTQINPGAANKADWASVSFKGGSEVGVLNLTTLVTAKGGSRICFSATWNDHQALDESKATAAYASVLSKLAKG